MCTAMFFVIPNSERIPHQSASAGNCSKDINDVCATGFADQRQIFLAVDVSTSTREFLAEMSTHVLEALTKIRHSGPIEVAVYLFNQQVMPFPNEALCVPRRFEEANMPTLRELQRSVAGGTAILDTLARLLADAEAADGNDRRIILLTDGWERSSRMSLANVRRLVRHRDRKIDISIIGFVHEQCRNLFVDLVEGLGLPEDAWFVATHNGDSQSISASIADSSWAIVNC